MQKSKIILAIVLIAIAALLIKLFPQEQPIKEPKAVAKSKTVQEIIKEAGEGTWFIQGSLAMKRGWRIQKDLRVCAQDIFTKKEYCTQELQLASKKDVRLSYLLPVPASMYEVYTMTNKIPWYKAYYTIFVSCGMGNECESHTITRMQVKPGETVYDIRPEDRYMEENK